MRGILRTPVRRMERAGLRTGLRWKLSAAIALVAGLVAVVLSLVVHNAARVSMLDNARELANDRLVLAQRNYELNRGPVFPYVKVDDPELPDALRESVGRSRRASDVSRHGEDPDIWAAVPVKGGHVLSVHMHLPDRSTDMLKDLDQALVIGSVAVVLGGSALGVLIGGQLSRRLRKAAAAANRVAKGETDVRVRRPSAGSYGTRPTIWRARWTPWRTRCGSGWRPSGGSPPTSRTSCAPRSPDC